MPDMPVNQSAEIIPLRKEEGVASYALLDKTLIGKTGKTWRPIKRIDAKKERLGGSFSVNYLVVDDAENQAFMKATDIGFMSRSGEMARALLETTHHHLFEVKLHETCRGSNLDKIIRALDHGETDVVHHGVREAIFFIVFELAEDDTRSVVDKSKGYDFLWSLHAMHNLTIAVQQLHTKNIAHNDIKPANVLVFDKVFHKLGDLSRAIQDGEYGPFDRAAMPGDWLFAAPEQLYKMRNKIEGFTEFDARRASDLYMLGSMCYFLVTGVHLTAAMNNIIGEFFVPVKWTGTYEEVIPYLDDAFGVAMQDFKNHLSGVTPKQIRADKELVLAVRQLCNPNPNKRGHPHEHNFGNQKYSVERYVSLFNKLIHQYQIG